MDLGSLEDGYLIIGLENVSPLPISYLYVNKFGSCIIIRDDSSKKIANLTFYLKVSLGMPEDNRRPTEDIRGNLVSDTTRIANNKHCQARS